MSESAGIPQTPESESAGIPQVVQTAFLVVVHMDGSLSAFTDAIPEVTLSRRATLDDLEMYSAHLSRSAGRALLVQSMTPTPETTADKVSSALAKRSAKARPQG